MIIAAIGTASRTPTSPIIIPQRIIEIKITTVFIQSVLFMSSGIRTLFSIILISHEMTHKITHHQIQKPVNPAITAGILPIIGPT